MIFDAELKHAVFFEISTIPLGATKEHFLVFFFNVVGNRTPNLRKQANYIINDFRILLKHAVFFEISTIPLGATKEHFLVFFFNVVGNRTPNLRKQANYIINDFRCVAKTRSVFRNINDSPWGYQRTLFSVLF